MSDWRDELRHRLEPLHLRPEREAEIVEELSQHLDDRVRELVLGGETPEAARAIALSDLDEPEELMRRLAAIEARSPYRLPPPGAPSRGRWLASLWQDIRHSIRSLRRTPGFTITVIAAFALTVGPTTAILSVGNWLLWRPIPGVAEPDRLAVVWFGEWRGPTSVSPRWMSEPNLSDIREASPSIAGAAGWQESSVSFAVDGATPRHVGSAHASVNFFDLLGIRPIAGRVFTPEDDRFPFGSPVAVISHRLSQGVFGGPANALGRSMTLNGRRMSVVGVLPPGFVGATPYSDVDVWYPATTQYYLQHWSEASRTTPDPRGDGLFYTFVMRLAPDASFDQLTAQLDVTVPTLAERYPDANADLTSAGARVFPGLGAHELMRPRLRRLVGNLLLVGGVLVLLGSANVMNLLLARGVSRHAERALRLALGASRARVAQLMLTESCLLALAGAGLGVAAAFWIKELIRVLLLPGLYATSAGVVIPIDARVLGWTLGLALVCGLCAGVAPVWTGALGRSAAGQLQKGSGRQTAGRSRLRTGLAAVQLALSLALVTNAVLLVGTLRHLATVDPGFNPEGVSVHYLDLDSHGYRHDRAMAYNRDLLARLQADPSLQHVSLSARHPYGSGRSMRLPDPAGSGEAEIEISVNHVTPDYFAVLGLPITRGRTFEPSEAMGPAALDGTSAIVDEQLARRLFGESEPIGQRIRIPGLGRDPAHDLVVVGVAGAGRFDSLIAEPELTMYVPFTYGRASVSTRPVVMVRSVRSVRDVDAVVKASAAALDPTLPVRDAELLTASIESTLSDRRLFAWMLSLLGALGFLLAAIGLYGLLAQMVGERTREFGIRLAIGAGRPHIFGLVLRQAVWIAVLGGAAGLGLAALGSRVVESQLVGVSRLEPWVYSVSALSLGLIVVLAALRPARVATRIEPVEALRAE